VVEGEGSRGIGSKGIGGRTGKAQQFIPVFSYSLSPYSLLPPIALFPYSPIPFLLLLAEAIAVVCRREL
jgi:hypothetical protein